MRASRRQDFLLGLLVLAVVVLLVGTILFVYPRLGVETREVRILFRHDAGLAPIKPGSPVLLAGAIQVGKVERIELVDCALTEHGFDCIPLSQPAAGRSADRGVQRNLYVRVVCQIADWLTFYDGCRVTTNQPPVGGGGYVDILSVGVVGREARAGPIEGLPPQSMAATIASLSQTLTGPGGLMEKLSKQLDESDPQTVLGRLLRILANVDAMTAQLAAQISPDQQRSLMRRLYGILANVESLTAALKRQAQSGDPASLLGKVHASLDELDAALVEARLMLSENRPVVRASLAQIQRMSTTLGEQVVPAVAAQFDPTRSDGLLSKLHAGLDSLQRSLDHVETITAEGRRLVVLSRPQLERTIENVKQASERLNTGIQELMLTPWRIFPPLEGVRRQIEVLEAARRFAEAASYLDDATRKMDALLSASSDQTRLLATPEELESLRSSLKAAFERFESAEDYFWQQLKR